MEPILWKCFTDDEADHFCQLFVTLFTLLGEKYHSLATEQDLTSQELVRTISAESNVASVSCFTSLEEDMIYVILMRNVAVLSAFVEKHFAAENLADSLTEIVANESVTRLQEIYCVIRDLFKKRAYFVFRNISAENSPARPGNESENKVSKLGKLFLHHLVRVFAYLKTIHPTSVKNLFSSVVGQLIAMIKKSTSDLPITYTDIELMRRLLSNYISPSDVKILADVQVKMPLSDTDIAESSKEIDLFLDKNRFHFISFS